MKEKLKIYWETQKQIVKVVMEQELQLDKLK